MLGDISHNFALFTNCIWCIILFYLVSFTFIDMRIWSLPWWLLDLVLFSLCNQSLGVWAIFISTLIWLNFIFSVHILQLTKVLVNLFPVFGDLLLCFLQQELDSLLLLIQIACRFWRFYFVILSHWPILRTITVHHIWWFVII